jgi:tetratricopeptide (TPR) repeat protein
MTEPPGEGSMITAVARVLSLDDGSFRGSAFAVRERTAVTAFHCVAERKGADTTVDRVALEFAAGQRVEGSVAGGRKPEDWALIALDQALSTSSRPIALRRDAPLHEKGRCLGFAVQAAQVGLFAATSSVAATEGRIGAAPVLQLDVEPAQAGLALHGLSGGPVLYGSPEEAIGVVRSHLPDPEDAGRPAGGVVFACPGSLVADALGPAPRTGDERHDAGELEQELTQAAGAGDSAAAVRLAELLQETGRLEEAERWLRQAARGGYAAAQFALGRHLEATGRGEEALPWIRRAATGGSVPAANTLGIRLRQQGRDDAALPWLEAAVEGGDAMAAHTLARIYEDRDQSDEAERWERFSAGLGDIAAAYDLGRLLLRRRERDEALVWLQRSAASGDPNASRLLHEIS